MFIFKFELKRCEIFTSLTETLSVVLLNIKNNILIEQFLEIRTKIQEEKKNFSINFD